MKFKKLFSLSALCLVGVMGVGLLGACDNEDEDVDICTDETCSSGDENDGESGNEGSGTNQNTLTIDEGLYTFSGNLTLDLVNEGTGTIAEGGVYHGSVDIPLTMTISVDSNNHYTLLFDGEIPIVIVPTEQDDIKLTGYGGGALESVSTSHFTTYYDSNEDNVYYHRIDSGRGNGFNIYELWGEYTSLEFMKNPLLYITRDMLGVGASLYGGIDDKVSGESLDSDAVSKTLKESAVFTDIAETSDESIGTKIETGFDGGATYDNSALLGKVSLAASIYDDHSSDSLYAYIPTCFSFGGSVLGQSLYINCDLTMILDLTIDSYSKTISEEPFSEFTTYISENASHFVSNSVTEETSLDAEAVNLTEKTYTDVTTYTGTISLTLFNTSNNSYTGTAECTTILEVGTYEDDEGEAQTTYLLSCEIPSLSVEFTNNNYIQFTGYANGGVIEVNTSELTALYDTGDDIIVWHRHDESIEEEPDTYDDWGAYEQEEFAKNPMYYVTHDLFGCGARLYEEATDAVTEEMLSDFVGSLFSADSAVSAELKVPFTYTAMFIINYNLEFDLAVSLTKDSNSSDSDGTAINTFISYVNSSTGHYLMNVVVEDYHLERVPVELTAHEYTSITTYEGTITLSLTNTGVTSVVDGETIYTYSGEAEIETTLEVGTYTDENEETQYTFVLDCDIPATTVYFTQYSSIKLTGYGNNVLSNSVETSHLSAYYDTGEGIICWHRIDTGSDKANDPTLDTYENCGAFEQEEFAKNPYYYIFHDFFGCGQRIYETAVNAISEESIVGSNIVDLTSDEISAGLTVPFTWLTSSLQLDMDVSLTKDSDPASTTESELISEFVSYISSNPECFITNKIVEVSYLSTDSDETD